MSIHREDSTVHAKQFVIAAADGIAQGQLATYADSGTPVSSKVLAGNCTTLAISCLFGFPRVPVCQHAMRRTPRF